MNMAVPKHRQMADSLRARIAARELPRWPLLPGEMDLAAEYGFSRETVRKVLRALEGEGLISSSGSGLPRRVSQNKPITLRVSDEESLTFIADMAAAGHVAAPPVITVKIEGDRLVREVLREVDGQPHNLARWSFPLEIAQGTRLAYDTDIPEGSIRYLKEGLGWARLVQDKEIEARMPSPEEARVLRMPPGVPVFAEYRGGAQDGTVVFSSVRILRADRTRLVP